MCSCGIDTPCYGGCPCGCKHTGPVDAKPTDVRSDYQRGLDAARDAVAALPYEVMIDGIERTDALAAIDALRGTE